ncbi:MAG: DUF2605 domain-containing protein [Oscillatoria sp. PMC 1068.18]|nr:DUF2605 domain-containing protein [Oscillatoria sp. PMC 1076.18]MEC4988325.1 DUF2605 domain-containing protein [Oscillatoria sp. PMC 1068.18]
MTLSQPSENKLLKAVLEPLLNDFQDWFERSRNLLENEKIIFLSDEEQEELLKRLKNAQQEVRAAKMLFKATGGQAGIDTATLIPWHNLVTQCWQVSMRWRSLKNPQSNQAIKSKHKL